VCRYYAIRANAPIRVAWHLVGAPNSLLAQSRRDLSGFEHADGWGIAAYDGDRVQVQRRAAAAHDGHHFCAAAEGIEATTVLAHVRRATVGRVGLANTHPFVHGRFALVHNGTVPYFADIRPRLLDAMTPEHRAAIQGGTDSEHLLHLILSSHAQTGGPLFASLVVALRHVVGLCREIGQEPHLGLNVLLTDGVRMVGSRWRRTLHYLEQRGIGPDGAKGHDRAGGNAGRALVIASEPTNGAPWPEVPERSVFEVTSDLRLRIEPLEDS
jgi:predicted glutamine amidotransferase